MAHSEAKTDILKGSWQDLDHKCANDEKHAPREPRNRTQHLKATVKMDCDLALSPKYHVRKLASVLPSVLDKDTQGLCE